MNQQNVTFVGGPLDLQRRALDVDGCRTFEVPIIQPMRPSYGYEPAQLVPYKTHTYDILRLPSHSRPEPVYVAVWRERWA